jgi:hypothetical protein
MFEKHYGPNWLGFQSKLTSGDWLAEQGVM